MGEIQSQLRNGAYTNSSHSRALKVAVWAIISAQHLTTPGLFGFDNSVTNRGQRGHYRRDIKIAQQELRI